MAGLRLDAFTPFRTVRRISAEPAECLGRAKETTMFDRLLRAAVSAASLCSTAPALLCASLAMLHVPAGAQAIVAIEAPRLVIAKPGESPVSLRSVRVETEIAGRSALTSVTLTFFNPNARQLEGELQFPLREGQAIAGMAMQVGGAMREAVPVDKARGEAVFEDVTRANIDPALVSHTQGNNYKLRVYPIEARSEKVVVLRYVEALATHGARSRFVLPIAYPERLANFSASVRVAGAVARPIASARGLDVPAFEPVEGGYRWQMERRDLQARGALDVEWMASPQASVTTQQRDGRTYFAAQVPVAVRTAARTLPSVVSLVWDSSGSGAERDHGREFALLGAYFARARNIEVKLVRLRDTAEATQSFRVVDGDWHVLRQALESVVYDGATQFGAFVPDATAGEVLLFSDGLSNFGDPRFASAPVPARVPVYAISAAVRHDAGRLRSIAETSGGRHVDLLQGDAAQAAARLLSASTRVVALESDGAAQLVAASPYADEGSLTLAGELTETKARVQITLMHPSGKRQVISLDLDGQRDRGALAAQAWARLRIAALDAEYDFNRAEIRRLGTAFGIVTRETSLIILDRAEDYARHDIAPPSELAAEVARIRVQTQRFSQANTSAQLDRVAKLFEAREAWWKREFPKGPMPRPAPAKEAELAASPMQQGRMRERRSQDESARSDVVRDAPPRALAISPAPPAAPATAMGGLSAAAKKAETSAISGAPLATIRLQAAVANAPYAARLRAAADGDIYRVYLDERSGFAHSTAFILDVADLLYERGLPVLATRVLSNLAEMDLENREILRILGARLVQAGRADLAVPVYRKVLRLAPDEPQSYRDLGLALAANDQSQAAIEALYDVVLRPWSRFPDVEVIALAELNAIVATSKVPLDTARIDPRLLKNMPLDLRATLSWDADNTDIDLWVTDPNGERAYYGHPQSYQGGRVSRDITSGYGPEEFSLRHAKPGKYTVRAQFYGHRQQIVSGATTLQLVLFTGFGTAQQKEQRVTLRLKEARDQVLVGEFEVQGSE
jgi:tetratricopeptide (TPR) repeat protein